MKSVYNIALATVGVANAAGYNYDDLGVNWADLKVDGNLCGTGLNQSPINLISEKNKDGWEKADYKVYDGSADQFTKIYENPYQAEPKFNGHTVQVDFADTVTGPMTFVSNIAEQVYGAPKQFSGLQFHFHAQSEHTVDGELTDFEMHTVHLPTQPNPTNGYMAAAVGIMFSVNKYNAKLTWAEEKIIENFFENINFDAITDADTSAPVDWILYNDLLSLVNTDNRWVYRGSVTTPPCAQNVYWNVMTTVYPIKQEIVDKFKSKLAFAKIEENRRVPQETKGKNHDVIYLKNNNLAELQAAKGATGAALGGMMVVLGFFLVLLCISVCFLGKKAKDLK